MLEEDILPKRYEIFTSDYDWVQSIRGSLLGLEACTTPSKRDIDNSSRFVPRAAASESELPEVITEHWLPILRREGLLMECPPDQFTAPVDWVPLYTHEGLQKYLPAALSSFPSQGAPSLIAIVPPEFHVGTDKEFLLCNFHHHQCLVRQSFNLKGRHRQLVFCPYCRVINGNSDTALSHVRKHIDLQFICGGCYSRSFLNELALNMHMRTQCPSVSAIRNCSCLLDGRTPCESLDNHTMLQEAELWDFCGALMRAPLLITQGSLEQSLGISVHQDADLLLEAVHPAMYLHLLTYAR